jgi:hypothetical protein
VTLPVNPRLGVTVIVEVPLAPGAMLTAVLDRVKFGPVVTVTGTVAVTVVPALLALAELPVTVTT